MSSIIFNTVFIVISLLSVFSCPFVFSCGLSWILGFPFIFSSCPNFVSHLFPHSHTPSSYAESSKRARPMLATQIVVKEKHQPPVGTFPSHISPALLPFPRAVPSLTRTIAVPTLTRGESLSLGGLRCGKIFFQSFVLFLYPAEI